MQRQPPVVDVHRLFKKYCRNLKRSMWYGVRDLATEFTAGDHGKHHRLRVGEFYALRNISFRINAGECVALLGPNGAGKSTMMKILNGLLKPNSGSVEIRGKVGALIELGTGFNPQLTGRENVFINGAVLGLGRRDIEDRFDEILEFSELGDFIDAPVKTYSSGMRVRLGYSVAAHLRPQLLLLDEVLAVGDVGFRMKCFAHLEQLRDSGTSIILVSHALGALARVAQRVIVFGRGQKVFDGELEPGIAKYEELVGVQSKKANQTEDSIGSGRAKIAAVRCADEDGQEVDEFRTGDEVRVQIRVDCNESIKDGRLNVQFFSPSSGKLAGISSAYVQQALSLDVPGKVVELVVPSLPLLNGAYFLHISLFGRDNTDLLDQKKNVARFRVVERGVLNPGFGLSGPVKIEHHWNVVNHELGTSWKEASELEDGYASATRDID